MGQQYTSSHAHLILKHSARRELYQDVHQRTSIEACGALLGRMDEEGNWEIEHAHPLKNTSNSPVYFEFAPEDLLAVEMRNQGSLIGIYHSHPTGFAQASSTDCENMFRVNVEQGIPWVWLIICGPFHTTPHAASEEDQDLNTDKLLAYFHYEREGLQQLDIICQN